MEKKKKREKMKKVKSQNKRVRVISMKATMIVRVIIMTLMREDQMNMAMKIVMKKRRIVKKMMMRVLKKRMILKLRASSTLNLSSNTHSLSLCLNGRVR